MKAIKKVYGPYYHSEGRSQVVVLYEDGTRKNKLLSRFRKELELGEDLPTGYTVDHKDRVKTNDEVSNLKVIPKGEHSSEDAIRVEKKEIVCVLCGRTAEKKPNHLDGNAKQGKAGPFCGKRCAGRYGAMVQHGNMDRLQAQPRCKKESRTYFQKQKPE